MTYPANTFMEANCPEIMRRLEALEVAATVTLPAAQLRTKYQQALINGKHMAVDTQLVGLVAIPTVSGAVDLAAAIVRANLLQAAFAVHAASVGTATVDGAHLAADTATAATLAAVPVASDLGTAITLAVALAAADDHGSVSGVHFHDDATFAAVTITPDPPVTLANVLTALNTLTTAYQVHFALHS